MVTTLRLFSGLFLLLLNGFFVSIEFALTRLRQFDEKEMEGDPGLQLAWSMTEQLEIYLTACQVGITVTSILLGVVFEPAVTVVIMPLTALLGFGTATTHGISIVLAIALIQLMHTVWGEQSPTYLGVEIPKTIASWGARPLYWWAWLAYPWIYIGDHMSKATLAVLGVELTRSWTHEESPATIRQKIGELLHDSALDQEEQKEVIKAYESTKKPVRDVIVPRSEVVSIPVDSTPQRVLEIIRENQVYTRFPLIGDGLIDCQGVLYTNQLLGQSELLQAGELNLRDLATPAFTLEAETSVNEAIDQLQKAEQELAIVVENGEALGIVTDSHLFEAVVGELDDPLD